AEDGVRDFHVTGVQTCALPIFFHNVNFLSNQLTANEKERKKLEMMREDWIGNISHDIKTPLASIQGYAELIKDQDYQFPIEEIKIGRASCREREKIKVDSVRLK